MKVKTYSQVILLFDILFCIIFTVPFVIEIFAVDNIDDAIPFIIAILCVVAMGMVLYGIYYLLCKSYYVFDEQVVKFVRNGKTVRDIEYEQIKVCECYRWFEIFDGLYGAKILYQDEYFYIGVSKRILKKQSLKTLCNKKTNLILRLLL